MKTRVISAIILIAVLVPLLIIGGTPFKVLVTVLALGGVYELLHIKDKDDKIPKYMKLLVYLAVIVLCYNNSGELTSDYTINYKMISCMIFLFLFPIVFINDNNKYNVNDALYLVASVLFIGFSFNLIIIARNYDLNYLIYLLLITTITDTFALFTGKLVGNHKLCPSISPNKTIEGSLGGSIMGTFVASAFYFTVIGSHSLPVVIGVTFVLSVIGQIGDLVFSAIKRYYKQKDFSELIPGHGGILDRFDSLIFVVLAFILLIDFI